MEKKQKRLYLRIAILAVLVAAIVYTIYTTANKNDVKLLKVGDDAPNFSLVDLNGKTHKLSDYKGQGVLLNFWGTWCKPCKKEMPAINDQYKEFKDQGIQILGINIAQSELEVTSFTDKLGVEFPIVIDKTRSVMRAYNVDPLPATILINKDGKIENIITGEMKEKEINQYLNSIKP
ncbi:thiol-disulfide oxidoreductase ResA [Rummeliibacillus sp. G93]|uniref:Thiol-disulfide oxidoreductase n=1 Tax=Rummeliibacillus stabekisii TaxID=241244 RepID=A0A143HHN5_9BACL|nr:MULTISPECIES: thiol-disulfide oxidoreductase ResA [Rummeliibacillus]AMX01001.1 thiol-disulfide oxidoreductase [Rummeliibacillus stabekisii]MCM3315935.1 thiol-disulfide oxidoreductase ResA [Rummeliibacillus stabekisii]UQW98999.1 thiol-disulfide oxidoreductase ResA [Rummeliibacillus sp. G93]